MVLSRLKDNICILKHFCRRELAIFFSDYWNTVIDSLSWPVLTALVFGYVFPHMGMDEHYGSFALVGSVVALSYFVAYELGHTLTSDFDGSRHIDFEFGLPVSPSFIILKDCITKSIQSFLMTLPLPFIGKIILWHRFDMTHFSVTKYLLIFVLLNICFNFFSTWMAGFVKSKDIAHFRIRIVEVLFFSGCFLFPWIKLHEAHSSFSYFVLLNPVTFAMEGTRVAFFGQEGSIAFATCCFMLMVFSALFFAMAIVSWKKRLDYVPFAFSRK